MNKKRILIFSTAYFPLIGGAEMAVKEITDRISDCEFVMVSPRFDKKLAKKEQLGNVSVYRVGIGHSTFDKFFFAFLGYRKALKMHKKNNFSVVWSIMASYAGFASLTFKRKTGIPFLLTLQEGDSIEHILKKAKPLKNKFYNIFREADGLQAISKYLLEWGREIGFRHDLAEVIPNGVDVDRFTREYGSNELHEIRQNFGFSDGAIVLVTASRLVKKNDLESAIQSLPLLPNNVCFVICGTGELDRELKNLVKALGLKNRVKFLGNVDHGELPKVLQASDIFVRPSLSEGLGNAFLEAMACGLPTIGTMVGGIPDFLADGKTGFACEVKSPESVAHNVKKILAMSEDRLSEIRATAGQMVVDKYNWDGISVRMRSIFEKLSV